MVRARKRSIRGYWRVRGPIKYPRDTVLERLSGSRRTLLVSLPVAGRVVRGLPDPSLVCEEAPHRVVLVVAQAVRCQFDLAAGHGRNPYRGHGVHGRRLRRRILRQKSGRFHGHAVADHHHGYEQFCRLYRGVRPRSDGNDLAAVCREHAKQRDIRVVRFRPASGRHSESKRTSCPKERRQASSVVPEAVTERRISAIPMNAG